MEIIDFIILLYLSGTSQFQRVAAKFVNQRTDAIPNSYNLRPNDWRILVICSGNFRRVLGAVHLDLGLAGAPLVRGDVVEDGGDVAPAAKPRGFAWSG